MIHGDDRSAERIAGDYGIGDGRAEPDAAVGYYFGWDEGGGDGTCSCYSHTMHCILSRIRVVTDERCVGLVIVVDLHPRRSRGK